ncbi:MAG: type VI secretion system baseplate subunit TssG [Planctomycetia bacterium]|nr:type VI secretion system baseplate subunit TssG [Planctomycetia bacterium]
MSESSSSNSVDRKLQREPYAFGFFQAVRVLERLWPNKAAVGQDSPPSEEVVRFLAHQSLEFPASEIYGFKEPIDKDPARMTVTFMGMTGSSGVLPRPYTELVLARSRQKDTTLRSFLDLFNHRLISLFYRAWEKYRFWIGYERAAQIQQRPDWQSPHKLRDFSLYERPKIDLFSEAILNVAGLGSPSLRYQVRNHEQLVNRREIDDETLRYYAGHFSQQRHSAIGLESMLSDFFGVRVQVHQFFGQWLCLDREYQTQLVLGGNTELGMTAIVGERVWDIQSKFRIEVGPLTYSQFRQFLPAGSAHRPMAHLSRLYAGLEFDMDMQLTLKSNEVPPCQLGAGNMGGTQLGWDTWIRSTEFTSDQTDSVFTLKDEPSVR